MNRHTLAIAVPALLLLSGFVFAREAGTEAADEDWKAAVRTSLGKRVNLSFAETPLADAFKFLARYGEVGIVTDPHLDGIVLPGGDGITLQADDISLKNVLSLITELKGLAWDLRWGVVFVSTAGRLKQLPKTGPEVAKGEEEKDISLRRKLRDQKISFSFAGATLGQAFDFIRTLKKINIVFDPAIAGETEGSFDLEVADRRLDHAISLILLPRGLTYQLRDGVVFVVRMGGDTPKRRLEASYVELSVADAPIRTVLARLERASGVPVRIDPALKIAENPKKISLKTAKIPVKSALDLVTMTTDLAWDARWGVAFVSTAARLRALPRASLPVPAAGRMEPWELSLRERIGTEDSISFSFDGASIPEALEFIATLKKLNIVIDPKSAPKLEASSFDLSVENVKIADALALVLYPRGCRYELKHEVIVVRTTE